MPYGLNPGLGLYPIVIFQYSSTTLYQVSYHIQYLFFKVTINITLGLGQPWGADVGGDAGERSHGP